MKDGPSSGPSDTRRLGDLANPHRLQALRDSGMLPPEPEDDFDRLVSLASRILQVPTAAVTFVDDKGQHFKAMCGFSDDVTAARGTPLSHSFCKHVVLQASPLSVPDSQAHPRFRANPAVEELGVAAYLGVPIHSPDGEVLGSFCAIDNVPREWSEDDTKTLRDLAKVVEAELVMRATVARRDLVLDEMTHRIKNLCTVVVGMIRLDRHKSDTADELAERLRQRITALGSAHELIVPVVSAGAISVSTTRFLTVADKLLKPFMIDGHVHLDGPDVVMGEKAAVYVALALHEISTNAVKYGALSAPQGKVALSWEVGKEALTIHWRECGHHWDSIEEEEGGFGSRLLDLAIRGSLDGTVTKEVTTTSFEITITIPMAALAC